MKKLLLISVSLLSVLLFSTAMVFAAHHHRESNAQVMTVEEVKANAWDDQHVILDGHFVEKIYGDMYLFKDVEGNNITAEVDDDQWYNVELDKKVRIFAEVDKDRHGDVKLDVKHIQKMER